MSNLITKAQASKSLSVCIRTIDQLMASNAIEFIKIGRAIRFRPEAITDFITKQTVNRPLSTTSKH